MAEPTFSNVTTLLDFEAGPPLVDASNAAASWAIVSDAGLSSAQAKFGTQSLDIVSNGYLEYSSATVLFNVAGAFTIQMWVRPDAIGSAQTLVESGGLYWGITASGALEVIGKDSGGTTVINFTTGTLAANTWHYVEINRDGSGSWRQFVDGVSGLGAIESGTVDSAAYTQIGRKAGFSGVQPFIGYIDEVRIVDGEAVNTTNYTPPTTAHATSGSTDAYISVPTPLNAPAATLTQAQNVYVLTPSPLGAPQSLMSSIAPVDARVALTSPLGSPEGLMERTLQETTYFDPFYGDVGFLIEFDGVAGATTATDAKGNADLFFNAGAQLSATKTLYGATALDLDGVDDYVMLNNSSFAPRTNDYTIEIWFNPSAVGTEQIIYDFRVSTEGAEVALYLKANGSVVMRFASADRLTSTTLLVDDNWYHLTVCRNAGTTRLYVDGVPEGGTYVDSSDIFEGSFRPVIGRRGNTATPQFFAAGSFAGFRATSGSARYGADAFGPPVAQYATTGTPDARVVLPSVLGPPVATIQAEAIMPAVEITDSAAGVDVSDSGDVAPASLSDSAATTDTTTTVPARSARSEATANDTLREKYVQPLREAIKATAATQTYYNPQAAIIDTAIASAVFAISMRSELSDALTATDELSFVLAVMVLEQAAANAGLDLTYNALAEITNSASVGDLVRRALPARITDSAAVAAVLDEARNRSAELTEALTAADSVETLLTLVVTETATATATDSLELDASYLAELLDSAAATVSIKLADEMFTGWVMNTEGQQAVYQYSNFNFNSFAQLDGKYYAAAETGLYRLGGDTDAGDAIDAHIKSLMVDFGTSRMKRVRSAYLGYTSTGKLMLKVRAAAGGELIEHWFEARDLTADTPREQRVTLAMGMKSRYWQFELANVDGADFEIDEFEMHPLMLQRRV